MEPAFKRERRESQKAAKKAGRSAAEESKSHASVDRVELRRGSISRTLSAGGPSTWSDGFAVEGTSPRAAASRGGDGSAQAHDVPWDTAGDEHRAMSPMAPSPLT